ncbi:MAG TPA: hypothetical protein VFS47_13210 [Steroidobacteraceae bacterium]|nr:hypothetical protein [Steroidobacteraceae bacterium]
MVSNSEVGRQATAVERMLLAGFDLTAWMFARFWWIAAGAIVGGALAFAYAQVTPKRYRAEVVMMPQQLPNGADRLGGLGGLGALVGLNLGGDSNATVALATLRGRGFNAEFIASTGMMPRLFPDRWDERTKSWKGPPPSLNAAVDAFDRSGIRTIVEDRKSGTITVRITWRERQEAYDWVNKLIQQVNQTVRTRAIQDAQKSLGFLESELQRTGVLEQRQAIYKLMEAQLNQKMLATVREDYAFRVIDRAILPQPKDYVWPRPLMMTAVGIILGALLGVALSTMKDAFTMRRASAQLPRA